jgi:hypothetical protein
VGIQQAGAGDRYLIELPGIAHYAVSREAVTIVLAADAQMMDARRLQRGAPAAAQHLLRGDAPLHAATLHAPQGAVVIAGRSASGKSTVAAALYQRGYGILADDLTCLHLLAGQPAVLPGYAGVTLWSDAAVRLGISIAASDRVHPALDKYVVTPEMPCTDQPVPLRAIFLLSVYNAPAVTVEAVTGVEKFQIIGHHTYNTRLTDALVSRDAFFALSAAIATSVPVWRIRRPRQAWTAEQIADQIERCIG